MPLAWTPDALRATIASEAALREAFVTASGAREGGVIRGGDAVAFLRPSGLADAALSKIWKLSTGGSGALRTHAELGQCLELVAREIESAGVGAGAGGGGYATPTQKAMGGSFGPGTPRTPASASVDVVSSAPMTDEERRKYYGHYRTLDKNGSGAVSVDAVVNFLSKASLPTLSVQLCVARASKGSGSIDRDMFAHAMHDVYALIRANGKTPVTPMVTPSGPSSSMTASAAPSAPSSAPKPLMDDNFFSSMGAPTLGASAREASSSSTSHVMSTMSEAAVTSAAKTGPTEAEREAERAEREAEAKAERAKREVEAHNAARKAADARIARAQKVIDDADADVRRARDALEAREAEADKMQRNATEQVERAKQQRDDLARQEARIKTEALEAVAAKKAQYQSTVAEFERLRAQVANAAAVAALPVKTMEGKLAKIEEETRELKMQTDKAAADASQVLVKKAVEVAKAERAKAAAFREMQAVDAKLEAESSRISKQIEALCAETESFVAKREARLAAHPQLIEDLNSSFKQAKQDAADAKVKTADVIAKCDKEQSELEAKAELAKAELEAVKSMMESDAAAHQSRLQDTRCASDDMQEVLRQAHEKRAKLAQAQAEEISAMEDKIAETEAAIKADEAARIAQERAHHETMAEKENKINALEAEIDDIRTSMQNQELMSQQALSDAENRLDAAESKLQEQREELLIATAKIAQENEELKEKLAIALEKEAEVAQEKADHAVLLASKQQELDELKAHVSTESARIEREIDEVQTEMAAAQAALDNERHATAKALEQLRDTLPKSAAVNAQIQALISAKGMAELDRQEAQEAAAQALTSYEEILARLEKTALDAAENEADETIPAFAVEREVVMNAAAISTEFAATTAVAAAMSTASSPSTSHERMPSFVEFEVSPGLEVKTEAFHATFDEPEPFAEPEPFGDSTDAFAAPDDQTFAPAEAFGDMGDDMFTAPVENEFDANAFTPPAESSEARAFSLQVPDAVPNALAFGDAAFDDFTPEGTVPDSPFDPSPRSIEFTGADAFGALSEGDSGTPTEDPFASTPTDPPVEFTTFDNQAFTAVDGETSQWGDDFASSPPREERSWNPEESATEDEFATAQKQTNSFDTGAFDVEDATPMGSVFATPSAPATFQTPGGTDANDGFGAFEEAPPTPAQEFVDAGEEYADGYEEDAPPTLDPIPPEDLSRSTAAWEKLRADADSSGVSGAQIVSLATKTGLDNADLAIIWNISCTPGASELSVRDFALFMHFLKHRVNGGELPTEMDADKRAYLLGSPETGESYEIQPSSPAAEIIAQDYADDVVAPSAYAEPGADAGASGTGNRLRIFIESVANIKDAEKMSSTHFGVTLVDGEGTPIEPSQNTPIGVQVTDDGLMRVQGGVTLNSTPDQWPEGSAVVLELRHYKQKEKKMSTRCWSFMEKESIRPGLFGLPLAVKPADTKRRKVKLFNKGNPDLKIRFSVE